MKKLVVCGCSFLTSSYNRYHDLKGSSWPNFFDFKFDHLNDELKKEITGWNYDHNVSFIDMLITDRRLEYKNLAFGGASNFMIRLQIDRAIKLNPDYIIVGATSTERIEVPMPELDIDHMLTWPAYQKEIEQDLNRKKAIEYYLRFLSDDKVTELKSYYIIKSGLDQIEKLGIPYVFLQGPSPMKDQDWSSYNVWPINEKQPWDFVNDKRIDFSRGNHLPIDIHKQMAKTLDKLTKNWSN